MSLDFFLHYGGRRLRQYAEQPSLESRADLAGGEDEKPSVSLDFELPPEDWRPRSVVSETVDPSALPQRFIDGCHSGETVTWVQDEADHPIPVRLAQIGGVCMRIEGRVLRREFARLERIVSLIVDPFPLHEVESLAAALRANDFRLLPANQPIVAEGQRGLVYDYERMRHQTHARSQYEMEILEELALYQNLEMMTLIDGPLRAKHHRMNLSAYDLVGVIKQHNENHLHDHRQCWRVYYQLEPGQRTPAFQLRSKDLPVVSWYLKLDGAHGAMPNWGIARVEISCAHFERQRCSFGYLDRLSNALLHLRCRQASYARAPVSMEPIVRAEESLKSLLTPPATLAQRFYHLTGL
ncbi:MAG TPA: hypothetical protein VMF69_00515 [Gemmataceae bacterium]|nr:hypothetical protein [Gemmataceae bacterium]